MSITRINNNVSAIRAGINLTRTSRQLTKNIEKLSSGLRINRAGDDAAGLTVRERLRTQIRGTNQAILNAQNGISMVNTSEAALDSLVSSLQRIRELAINAGNTGSNDPESILAIQEEVFQQVDEVNRIASTARFSTRVLFTGDNAVTSDIRAGQDEIGIKISNDPNASTMGSGTSILNVIRTQQGSENLLPFKNADNQQSVFATGIADSTDIVVSTDRLLRNGNAVTASDDLSTMTFGGVSVSANNIVTFQGVLSDGITPFAGSLSVTTGGGAQSLQALLSTIQSAIDSAETTLFGGVASNIPGDFVQTHVSMGAPGGTVSTGAGRIRFLSAQASGTTTTTLANATDAPSQFNISFNVIDNSGDLKHSVGSTRDFVGGQSVGGQIGNIAQGITGSTFDTGNFSIEVTDVVSPSRRTTETTIPFRDLNGNILSGTQSLAIQGSINGSFTNSLYTLTNDGFAFTSGDRILIEGTNADGSTFSAEFTLQNSGDTDTSLGDFQFATVSGLVAELNFRDRTVGSRNPNEPQFFKDAQVQLTGNGTLKLIDDEAKTSKSSLFIKFIDNNTNATVTDRAQLIVDGTEEQASISINGGPRQRVTVGDQVTLTGPKPTVFGEHTPELSFRLGAGIRSALNDSIFTNGTDTAEIVEQEFVGSLNGGTPVTFQNGAQNVFFESGAAFGVAETLRLDFDAIIDITGPPTDGSSNTGRAILISTVNNAINFQIGPFAGQNLLMNIPDLRGDNLGFGRDSGRTISNINVTSVEGVNEALDIIDRALDQVSRTRSALGAVSNRMETTIESLSVASENLTSSESLLSDVDIAKETSEFTSRQIVFQAGTSVLAQANLLPQGLLSLLG